MKITSDKENEIKTIDSIGYKTKHLSVKSLLDEKNLFIKQLTQFGFYDFRELESKKENDSGYCKPNAKSQQQDSDKTGPILQAGWLIHVG